MRKHERERRKKKERDIVMNKEENVEVKERGIEKIQNIERGRE